MQRARHSFENNVILAAREGVQIRPRGPAVFRDSVFRCNWYKDIGKVGGADGRNYLLDNGNLRNLTFVDETHDRFGTADSIVRGAEDPGRQRENGVAAQANRVFR